jgi:predicted permease
VTVNGLPFTVIAVAPPAFFGTEVGRAPDVIVPLVARDRLTSVGSRLAQPNSFWLRVMARLDRGVTTAQAESQMQSVHQAYVADVAGTVSAGLLKNLQGRRIRLVSGARGFSTFGDRFGGSLQILMAATGFVLLIGCANVAGLLMVRAIGRQRDTNIRLALGASRARLVRQAMIESGLLAGAGSAVGLLLGVWSANALAAILTEGRLEVALDRRVLAFTLVTAAASTILFGIAPALRPFRRGMTSAVRGSDAAALSPRARLGRLLVPIQVAMAFILLVGAGLFIRTLGNLRSMDMGFDGEQVLLATLSPSRTQYPPERVRIFYNELLERVTRLPGVAAASVADAPLLGSTFIDGLGVDGKDIEISLRMVSPGFFDTMGIRMQSGRDFSSADSSGAPRVAIINDSIARRYFVGKDPIGQRVAVDGARDVEVIAVVADTKYSGLRDQVPDTVYLPLTQGRFASSQRTLHVRTFSRPASMFAVVRQHVSELDETLPVQIRPFSTLIDADLERERLVAALSGCFAGLALLMTSIGLFGVTAHGVQRRTREVGIRMALGAQRYLVVWIVLRDCVAFVALGLCVGGVAATWLMRLVSSQLFAVSAVDPLTITLSIVVLLTVTAVAASVPARRAARVDPAIALRYD